MPEVSRKAKVVRSSLARKMHADVRNGDTGIVVSLPDKQGYVQFMADNDRSDCKDYPWYVPEKSLKYLD